MGGNSFHQRLKVLIHQYILLTYQHTKKYPSDERFGLTSQDRKAAVSVMLNYVEGRARMKIAGTQNQYEISYGSLKESIYCRFLAKDLGHISRDAYNDAFELKEEIGAMLYSTIQGIRKDRN